MVVNQVISVIAGVRARLPASEVLIATASLLDANGNYHTLNGTLMVNAYQTAFGSPNSSQSYQYFQFNDLSVSTTGYFYIQVQVQRGTSAGFECLGIGNTSGFTVVAQ